MDAPYCDKHKHSIGVATCKLCVIDELKQQRDELLAAATKARGELSALRQRIADAPVVGKVHWFKRFDTDCVVHTEVAWIAEPPPHGTKLISKEDLQE